MKTIAVPVIAALLLLFGVGETSTASQQDALYTYHYENVLGTSLDLKVLASSPGQSQKAEDAVLAEIDRENAILSSWDSSSEFSRWFRTRNQPVPVSPELFEVFSLFDHWRNATGGALDASAEAVTRTWQSAAMQERLPTPEELTAAVSAVHRTHWQIDAVSRTVTHTSDTALAMNSFVKSYVIGRAADAALAVAGVHGVVVNIGGDLVVRGQWTEPVSVADPESDAENAAPIAHLLIRDRAVATSGDYRRGFVIAGRHYSHIVDPRTGLPADEIVSSTVVAPNAATAGALATSFSVLSPDESRRVAVGLPGVEYLLVTKDGAQIASSGWAALEAPRVPADTFTSTAVRHAARVQLVSAQGQTAPRAANSSAAAAGALWNREFEVSINVELSLIPGRRINRPFVAVWIENGKHEPLKTIALWYAKNRYLPELHAWYGDSGLGITDNSSTQELNYISSISSATRPPGKYTLRWDGRDGSGKYIKSGKYTVLIEASREHGTYQIMRQEIDFNGMPQHFDLPGGVEIASASLDYHKIAK